VGGDTSPEEALSDFQRFPVWMWRNTEVAAFVGWLRAHNDAHEPKVRFHGIDLYSLYGSMRAVVAYLETLDPELADLAQERYACFNADGDSCEQEALDVLLDVQSRAADLARARGVDPDRQFSAEQNARVVVNAESYHRALPRAGAFAWNVREAHMTETLYALAGHAESAQVKPKLVVWAHNVHAGDGRATELGLAGRLTVGGLVRERSGGDVLLTGLTTYAGTVMAASHWGGPAERIPLPPAPPESWEAHLHARGEPALLLDGGELEGRRLERAVGVIFRPAHFHARLGEQFDAVLHFDETTAVTPLPATGVPDRVDLPETYPTGV
jgi:erythromycin esterase-like protein